ncbi:sigma-54 interaction domain-containing protein [Acidobacteriota bacterium]
MCRQVQRSRPVRSTNRSKQRQGDTPASQIRAVPAKGNGKDNDEDTEVQIHSIDGIVWTSSAMSEVIDTIRKVADCDATVLIQGESGTGKEVVAHAIHKISQRNVNPFVVINCSTIVDTLMESDLFGHERGSFTGAIERKAGQFEVAHMGTAFLDEISELPMPLQPKLLRIIQEKEFTRVGGVKPLKTDIRIVASTNRDVASMVQDGSFRQDLYYRLRVVQILIPPLRKRTEDIPILAEHFLKKYALRYNRPAQAFDKVAMDMLKTYSWPGNVRALEHVVEQAVVMTNKEVIRGRDIVIEEPSIEQEENSWNYKRALNEFNQDFLLRALAMTGGNKRETARLLGISHAKLYRMLAKVGLKE